MLPNVSEKCWAAWLALSRANIAKAVCLVLFESALFIGSGWSHSSACECDDVADTANENTTECNRVLNREDPSCLQIACDECPCVEACSHEKSGNSDDGGNSSCATASDAEFGGVQPIDSYECDYENKRCFDSHQDNNQGCACSRRRVPEYPYAVRMNQMVPLDTDVDTYAVNEMGEYEIGMYEFFGPNSMSNRSLGQMESKYTQLTSWISFMDNDGAYPRMVFTLGPFDMCGQETATYCEALEAAENKGTLHLGFPDAEHYRHSWTKRLGNTDNSLTTLKYDLERATPSEHTCEIVASRTPSNILKPNPHGSGFKTADDMRKKIAMDYRFDEIPTDVPFPVLLGFSYFPGEVRLTCAW